MTEKVAAGDRRFDRRTVLGASAGMAAVALPRTMIRCTEGEWFEASFIEELRSDPVWQIVDVADNHFAPVNAPELTAEALLSLV